MKEKSPKIYEFRLISSKLIALICQNQTKTFFKKAKILTLWKKHRNKMLWSIVHGRGCENELGQQEIGRFAD